MRLLRHLLVITLLVTVYPAHSVGLYKWVDENGVTHYSESPPIGRKAQDVMVERVEPPPDMPVDGKVSSPWIPDGGADPWDGCSSDLCNLVKPLDPRCETRDCEDAKRLSDGCTSVVCLAERSEFEDRMLARMRPQEKRQAKRGGVDSSVTSDSYSKRELLELRLAQLVADCRKRRGAKCDSDDEKRRLLLKELPLSHDERRMLLHLSPDEQRRYLDYKLAELYGITAR